MRKAVLTIVAIAIALGFAVSACGGGGGGDDQANRAATAAKTAPTVSTGSGEELPRGVTAAIETEADVWGLTAEEGAVWVQVDPPVDAVLRIDTETHEVTDRIKRGRNTAFDGESWWVAREHELVRLDDDSGKIVATIPVAASYLAVGDGAVWASGAGLTRIDPRTNKAVARIQLPMCVENADVEVGLGSAWVACKRSGTVVRIDARTNEVAATIRTGDGPHGIAIATGSVWVTNYQGDTVSRISPEKNKVVATIEDVGSGVGIAAGMGSIWVASGTGIARIDPKTNTIAGKLDLGAGFYYGIGILDGALWVSTVDQRRVFRIDPAAF